MIDVRIMWPIWLLIAALMVIAWLLQRARIRAGIRQPPPEVDDEAVRRILEEGVLPSDEDEPLDLDEIDREERAFWDEERWDSAEEL